jgi:hypothetical protein
MEETFDESSMQFSENVKRDNSVKTSSLLSLLNPHNGATSPSPTTIPTESINCKIQLSRVKSTSRLVFAGLLN